MASEATFLRYLSLYIPYWLDIIVLLSRAWKKKKNINLSDAIKFVSIIIMTSRVFHCFQFNNQIRIQLRKVKLQKLIVVN